VVVFGKLGNKSREEEGGIHSDGKAGIEWLGGCAIAGGEGKGYKIGRGVVGYICHRETLF